MSDSQCTAQGTQAEQLNRDCFCTTLDRDKLAERLALDAINNELFITHPQLFSNTSVFISPEQLAQMEDIIAAVNRVTNLPLYTQAALAQAPSVAGYGTKTQGVFMGYDFHLSESGPQIIEINTNAGGGFLNAALRHAQTACCAASCMQSSTEEQSPPQTQSPVEDIFMAMFLHEWQRERGTQPLRRIAIVDDNPREQFLYPEFKMAQRLFERHGFQAVIAAPEEFSFYNHTLYVANEPVDLIYNRLTDFSLEEPNHQALRAAFESGSVVMTPNPHQHALYADKRNLVWLSDTNFLHGIGASQDDIATLKNGIPSTQLVHAENADQLWANRKHLFFKPASGFGSRAAYRGDKITKRVWDEIFTGDYVAQQLVPPSERGMEINDKHTALKMDIRAYVYGDTIQLLAARLYQGQTTNFRTQGGGFAPVFLAKN